MIPMSSHRLYLLSKDNDFSTMTDFTVVDIIDTVS